MSAILFWQSQGELADADLAKFAGANRHTYVCLFAAVDPLFPGFNSPCDMQQNKNRRINRRYLFWQSQGELNPCSQNENLVS